MLAFALQLTISLPASIIIIIKALEDHAYLHDLRRERKQILEEEQKLKGLMDLAKAEKVIII